MLLLDGIPEAGRDQLKHEAERLDKDTQEEERGATVAWTAKGFHWQEPEAVRHEQSSLRCLLDICHQKEDEERGVTTKCAMKAFCTEFELDESKHEAERDKPFFAGEKEAKRQGRTQQLAVESCAGVPVLQIVEVRTFELVASVPARQTRTVESTEMVSGRVRVFRSFFFC